MKSLLILSATAGAGHVRAGEALAETARLLRLPLQVHHEDILNYTSPIFKKLYGETYLAIVNKSPTLWGYLYKKTRRVRATPPSRKSPLVKLFDHFNYRQYLQTLERLKPDAVLCTHFLPYAAIEEELRKPSWRIPFYSVPTDYDVHSLWVSASVQKYYVATEEAAWSVRSLGIPASHIAVTGIPVMPAFGLRTGQPSARRALGLGGRRLTVLILSGGYGAEFMGELVPSLARFLAREIGRRTQLVVVCGKNEPLLQRLRIASYPRGVKVRLFGFVTNIDAFMESADLLVTKSGGLTISEALAKHLPMVVFDPIPGQEASNADYLVEQGAALRANSQANLHFKLKHILTQERVLERMRSSARRIARPNAAQAILRDVIKLLR
jgi:processive 1,2-diacylglycerol beta-glucosyltransferase